MSSAWSPLSIPDSPAEPFTDYSRWRLRDTTDGRHVWDYLRSDAESAARPQTDADKYWLGIPLVRASSPPLSLARVLYACGAQDCPPLPAPASPLDAARNGYTFYKHLQAADGHWAGEYGGPMFLLPGLVIGSYVTGMAFLREERLEMVRYVLNRAHPDDGGWGLCVSVLVLPIALGVRGVLTSRALDTSRGTLRCSGRR